MDLSLKKDDTIFMKDKIELGANIPDVGNSITDHLKHNQDKLGRYKNLYIYAVSENNLKLAWDKIRGKSGNLSPGGNENKNGLPKN